MEFFNKLKKRLFTLNVEKKASKNADSNDENNNKSINNLIKAEKKFKKKIEKDLNKKLFKKNKIKKYVEGMSKTGFSFSQKIKEIQAKHNQIDEAFFEDLEDILIMSDISIDFVLEIINEIKKAIKIENVTKPELVSEILADKMFSIYTDNSLVDTSLNIQDSRVNVVLIVGVNGSGKTTSIAKIAHTLKSEGKKVLIAAADTFRAGAVEQLIVWSKKIGVDVVRSQNVKADPGSVVFDAIAKAKNQNYDVLIIDTAGRLQNKVNLMNELNKINRIIKKEIPAAPHESLLVLDATNGQNGISQAKNFQDVTNLTGIVLTKMDGTSKGGIVFAIKDQINLAVKLVGFGEKLDDLQEFDLDAFIYGMTKDLMEKK